MSRMNVQNGPRVSVLGDLNDYDDSSSEFDSVEEEDVQKDLPPWDLFKSFPSQMKDGSMKDNKLIERIIWVLKVLVYGLLFAIVFCNAIVAKSAVLFATSQLGKNHSLSYSDPNQESRKFLTKHTQEGRIKWTWCLILIFVIPECIGVLNALWYYLSKKKRKMPKTRNILLLTLIETGHTIGLVFLTFIILPEIGAVHGAAILCCLCFIPGLLNLSQNKEHRHLTKKFTFIIFDFLALVAQVSGMLIWPLIQINVNKNLMWIFPITLILCSIRWWCNFIPFHSKIGLVRFLSSVRQDLESGQHIIQGYVSFCRTLIFITGALAVNIVCEGVNIREFFLFNLTGKYKINLTEEILATENVAHSPVFLGYFFDIASQGKQIDASSSTILYVVLIQAVSAMMLYQSCKFAYRAQMHQFGFAFPINLASFGTVCLIMALCIIRNDNTYAFHEIIPDYLFFGEYLFKSWLDFLSNWYVWCWPIWLMSQIWITIHIWTTENEKLALVEKIFSTIIYDSLMIDQCLALNRRTQNENVKDSEERSNDAQNPNCDLKIEIINAGLDENIAQNLDTPNPNTISKRKDRITKIYACATMWHEEKKEMNRLVGSILRLDKDQCAMRVTQKYYKVYIKDYYELETHIFFDDAFCCLHGCVEPCNHDENETQVNQYVLTLVETVQNNVEILCMRSSPPTKYPTPYGGRLVWTLPGRTQLVVHLKDKNKIRHRKRWSQVMYMYYLLGYRLMGTPIDVDRKEIIAENTYILTLDGDIDFRPSAVKILVDLMKKNRDLGAACGRIHPIGSGPMVWIQKFEYAIGHWLHKSTEHTIGCVLCSPGCFSLFRAKAWMQHNVMAKYATKSSEARHYIQYDQGEDRWLCTLMLQVGARVEYSAASDAYTHAPETFRDVFIQRRRWIPSTLANIHDLLTTAKETRKVNDNISWLYIFYQWILMGSAILGPGTIFLMMVGAFVAAFRIDNWTSFLYNLIPLCIFVAVCFTCKERIQLIVAQIISVVYGLVMVIVLVGIMLQITEDGWLAPSSLLFFIVAIQLVVAGLLHPQEWTCLLCSLIYYITVPSMYMLLIIFSIFNVHNVTWGTREKRTNNKHSNATVCKCNRVCFCPEIIVSSSKYYAQMRPQIFTEDNNNYNVITNKKELRDEQRHVETSNFGHFIGKRNKQNQNRKGSLKFSLGNIFECVCCMHTGINYKEKRLDEINDSLQHIHERLKLLDRLTTTETDNIFQPSDIDNKYVRKPYFPAEGTVEEGLNQRLEMQYMTDDDKLDHEENEVIEEDSDILTQMSVTSSHEYSNFLINPYWLQDERMRKGEVDFLPNHEEEFWKSLIAKYLRPIENDEESQNKIAQELMDCRDAYLLKFFMINALFVLIVFLMQLNKEILHLQWPLSVKYNVTSNISKYEVYLTKGYLKLEPIGCLFIVGFISILGIQFIAMLIHRIDTFAHVLANKKITSCCTNKSSLQEDTVEIEANEIARGLQRIAEDEITYELERSTIASKRRTTIHELTENPQPSKTRGNFERFFQRKLHDPNVSDISVRFIREEQPDSVSGLLERASSRISKSRFNAFERRRSTIPAGQKKMHIPKSHDVYDDANDLRGSSHNYISYPQPRPSNSTEQFQYDNPGFKDEKL